MKTVGYAAHSADAKLVPYHFERRELRPNDVAIDIQYCGVCHSDLHTVNGDWGPQPSPFKVLFHVRKNRQPFQWLGVSMGSASPSPSLNRPRKLLI